MIKSVTVTNYRDESLKLDLYRPERSGFIISNIDGIGPVGANISTSSSATHDGSQFNSARAKERNIVLTLRYDRFSDKSVEQRRHETFKFFPEKKLVRLTFETDSGVRFIEGYTESNKQNYFSKDCMSQISIVCPDPYFYSESKDTTVFSGVVPMFEFPFENDSIDTNKIIISEIVHKNYENVPYSGDSKVGVIITIHATDEVSNINIYNIDTRESMTIDNSKIESITGSGIVANDTIIINTNRGNKSIQLLRNGTFYNILNALNRDASWFTLGKGDNIFAYTAEVGETALQFKIENRIIYEGV